MLNIDTSHPLYRPLWVRLLIVGFCAAWAVIEFVNREFFWGTIVGGIAAYAAYELLLKFIPVSEREAAEAEAGNGVSANGVSGNSGSDADEADKILPASPAESTPVSKSDAG